MHIQCRNTCMGCTLGRLYMEHMHTGLFVHGTHAWGAHWAVCTCTLSQVYCFKFTEYVVTHLTL